MKIIAIGANGIIGQAVVNRLAQNHEVISVGHSKGDFRVDIEDKSSIESLFERVGKVDAILCMAGNGAMGAFEETTNEGFATIVRSKIMGQVNVARVGLNYLNSGGSITLTSGQAANQPMPGTAAIAMGVAAINALIAPVALELTDGKRINAVSPGMVKETMESWGIDSSSGVPADVVARCYQESIEGQETGRVFDAV